MIRNEKVRNLVLCSLFAALIAVCSWISIPTTVPFTMQTFAVFVTIGILGGKLGTLAVLVYIVMGVIGLPVFSGFAGGYAALVGSTGGYIIGFIGIAAAMWLFSGLFGNKIWVQASGMVAGLLICYVFGTAWFMVVYGMNTGAVGLATVLSWCVIPFIVPDLLKIALALIVIKRLKPALRKGK
ncbi:MAG: biotin transporter BioY [Eubacteriales bacterium]|nr:biotin transporter BioY [Eubacteriales bacterium]